MKQIRNQEKKGKCIAILLAITMLVSLAFPTVVWADDVEEEIEKEEILKEIEEASANATNLPDINSRAAVVIERDSKTIIYDKKSDQKRAMASTTKIMTAIVVLEKSKLEDVVEVSKKAGGTGGSRLGLKAGDKITVHDLLYGLMLCSGNDAAIALSEHVGGTVEGFATMMNAKAEELKLGNTHFVLPHGLDMPEHYTTAYELAIMADYGLNNEKFAEIVNTKQYTVSINGNAKTIQNTNELLGNLDGVMGVKTGFTNNAGRCLVTYTKRGEREFISVVLGADTKKFRTKDSIKIIEYAFANYTLYDIQKRVEEEFENWKEINGKRIYIEKGELEHPVLALEPISYHNLPLKQGEEKDIKVEITTLKNLVSPVDKGEVIGTLRIKKEDTIIETLNIYNQIEIKKKNQWDYLKQVFEIYHKK